MNAEMHSKKVFSMLLPPMQFSTAIGNGYDIIVGFGIYVGTQLGKIFV
jgi:hypothetical protein